MRIRLKVAVLDVATGAWDMFAPDTFDDEALSGPFSRESSDQQQVGALESRAYAAAVDELVKRYASRARGPIRSMSRRSAPPTRRMIADG